MLPFFAASGHHLYLKSLYVYLQSMSELPKSNPNLHQKFGQGYHVVRRSERFWGGLSTDLVIEQVLMRSIKAVGGMTHGRGMTDLQRALWIMSTPACADMNRAMQHFTGVVYENSEQHKEVTCARIEKDYEDAVTISRYLIERNPFSEENGELRSIHTGEIAKETVNADNAKAIGEEIISGMNGHEIADYTFRKKNKAKIMNFSKSTVAIDNEVIAVDPQLLFQRLIAAIQFGGLEHDPATIFSYELSTFPLSMFDKEGMMRDPKPKSEIITEVKKHTTANNAQLPDQVKYVIDGGYLLHKIIWEKGATYNEICNTYIRYIQRHYGNHATIVFDGYDDNPSTKDSTHIRRSQGKVGKSVAVAGNVVFNMKKDDFLLNIQNKQAFLDLLGKKLINSNTSCLQASGDADFLIVQTAVISAKYSPTVVIGEDTDLIVLLLHHANIDDHKIYFTAEKTRRKKEHDVWCVTEAKVELGHDLCSSLLLLHAILGCDTTSRLFNIGKGKAVTCFLKDSNFRKNAINFTNEASITDDVVEVGKKMLLKIYGAKKELTLDEL